MEKMKGVVFVKIKRLIAIICVVCILGSFAAVTASASNGYYFELSSSGGVLDTGSWRYKNDTTAADVYPSSTTNIAYGARFLLRAQTSSGGTAVCSAYKDRYSSASFSIDYTSYGYAGNRQMCMRNYTGSSSYTVSAKGTWYP